MLYNAHFALIFQYKLGQLFKIKFFENILSHPYGQYCQAETFSGIQL